MNYLDIYYNKMIDYLLKHGIEDDPMVDFTSSYTMKDVLFDIGEAWGTCIPVFSPSMGVSVFERPSPYISIYKV